jgi:2-C-methyl-D-erythritol 4-phosphate cytidylyltransferase / 2-C-methyl-D-erythritol 2,4-cyclodiphosphate synthase
MKNVALIVAAGKGERAGGDIPKQFAPLAGKPLICHSVDAFLAHDAIDAIYVVIGADQYPMLAEALAGRTVSGIVTGGAERQDSVRAGLDAIAAAGGATTVLIHDAARPFVPAAVIGRLLAALETGPAAIPALPVVDTLAAAAQGQLGDVVDRTALARIQTPQAFRFSEIVAAHKSWAGPPATDDAQIARAYGIEVRVIEGDVMLDKVTHAADFALAEARRYSALISRTGMGYDVHRLEHGEDLWLCGVKIDHDKGLSGHSDADVALHALTDAILGALGDGDIGSHFPPSDPRWCGAASSRFLEHARDLVVARGGIIDHVDLTIICEAPKIGPHRHKMRTTVAALLQLPLDRVSIKATTTERLGFTGREEGIAAQALATVRL